MKRIRCTCQVNLRGGSGGLDVERAATICRQNNNLTWGSQAAGDDPYSVSLNVQCPHGYRAMGVWHTHPGGVPMPSPADIREARRMGVKHLCITVPETGETRCHEV